MKSTLATIHEGVVTTDHQVVQLFWLFFVLPRFGLTIAPMTVGILALGLNIGAYGAEVIRGAIGGVPRAQWEAASRSIFPRRDSSRRDPIPGPNRDDPALGHDRLYFQTTRLWLKTAPRLDLYFEAAVFRREIIDILAAAEVGGLESIGHIRRAHISMSFRRVLEHAQNGTVPVARELSE